MAAVADHTALRARVASSTPWAARAWSRSRILARGAKRLVDVVLGSLLAILFVPVMAALAMVLAWQLRVGPFFVHDRVGCHGRPFRFPKLRTLSPSTHCYADKTAADLVPPSRLAAILRARHLDELPQLLLVPLGALSLVGPRPKMLDEHEPIDPLVGAARTLVRQGCTGLWQIGRHNSGRVIDAPQYDLFYLRYGSLRMDAWILWRTVVQSFGAPRVALADVPRWTLGRGLLRDGEHAMVELALAAVGADRPDRSDRRVA